MKKVCLLVWIVVIQLSAFAQKGDDLTDMILIPGGQFMMGSDESNANSHEKPSHSIHLDAYYIDKFEVTRADYEEFILARGYQRSEFWSKEGWNFIQENEIDMPPQWNVKMFANPNFPASGISWYEAEAYANWRGKRLPTEAEWEKASKGNTGYHYPWGSSFDSTHILYVGLSRLLTVESFPSGASPYGGLDMAGSVWEWVSDWYSEDYYKNSPLKNPKGPDSGTQKILRGGSWRSNRRQFRCSYRYPNEPQWRQVDVGFRLAKDIEEPR